MIDDRQIHLIRKSFAKVVPMADAIVHLFYEQLFLLRPDYRKLFPGDMESQRSKLVATLAAVVHSLDQLEDILPDVRALGERHVGYGTADEDYQVVGEALLWTFRSALINDWDDEVEAAWAAAYGTLVEVMLEGARRVQAA